MRFIRAEYYRYLAVAAHNQNAAQNYILTCCWQEETVKRNAALVHEIYEYIQEKAKEGNMETSLDKNHKFWQVKEIHWLFEENGFKVDTQSNRIHWME